MLLTLYQNRTKLCRVSLLALVCFVIIGCSPVNLKYIDRETIKSRPVAFSAEMPRYHKGDSKPMSLGALRITSKDAPEGDPGRVLLLQRKHGVYMTETKIRDTGKKRYFMSVGINPKNGNPAVGFRMEF